MTTQKARRHFIAWSPQFDVSLRAGTRNDVIASVCVWRRGDDGPSVVSQEWQKLRRSEGWRITEVSE